MEAELVKFSVQMNADEANALGQLQDTITSTCAKFLGMHATPALIAHLQVAINDVMSAFNQRNYYTGFQKRFCFVTLKNDIVQIDMYPPFE